jgi:hypothetical protein
MAHSNETAPRTREDLEDTAAKERSRTPKTERPVQPAVTEIGGPKGPEPTRYGDWERKGICVDF